MISQHIIWVGIIILALGLYGVVRFWPEGGLAKTFSQHVAPYKAGVLYYIALFTITLPIFGIFFFGWFIPYYQPAALFSLMIAIALSAQYACTFVPEVGKTQALIHRSFALLSAVALLLSMGVLVFTGTFSLFDRIVLDVGLVAMAALLAWMIATGAEHKKILLIQSGYFFAFFATIAFVVGV